MTEQGSELFGAQQQEKAWEVLQASGDFSKL
jgi:hypothetical protein